MLLHGGGGWFVCKLQQDGGNLMYTGTRRGQILVHDLRSKSTFPQMLINHLSSLTCLRLSPDEHYIYASDFSGKVFNSVLFFQDTSHEEHFYVNIILTKFC